MKLRNAERKEIYNTLNRKKPSWKKEPSKNGFFDIETYTVFEERDGKTFLVDQKAYAIGGLDHEGRYRHAGGDDCLDKFLKHLSSQKGNIALWAFNVSYDANFVIRQLAKGSYAPKDGYCKYTEHGMLIASELEGDGLSVKFGCTGFGNKTMSLDKGGKVIGKTQKLEQPDKIKYNLNSNDFSYLNENLEKTTLKRDEEVDYLRNDVLLIPEILERIEEQQDTFSKLSREGCEYDTDLKMKYQKAKIFIKSNAGAAKDCLQPYLGMDYDERYRPQLPIDTHEDLYLSNEFGYLGGFTSGSPNKYKIDDENIKVYDINSMYPSIMIEGIPGGVPLAGLPPDKSDEGITGVQVKGTFCEGKKEGAIFDNKFFGKTFNFHDGQITFTILKETLDLANEMCDHDLEIYRYGHQPRCLRMKDYIKTQYEHRCKLKEQMKDLDPSSSEYEALDREQECVKVCLNSQYGKLAERHHEMYGEITKDNPKMTLKMNEPSRPCILSGSYVTSKARIKIMRAIMAEVSAGNEFLYCDTDSIFIIDKTGKRQIEVDPSKLGAGKCEGEFNRFRYGGKHKKYLLYNTHSRKVKMALSGLKCKKLIETKGSFEQMEKVFDPSLNIRFVKAKDASVTVDEDFGIDVLLKTNYDTNPRDEYVETNGKKKKTRIVDLYCPPPYLKLVSSDEG